MGKVLDVELLKKVSEAFKGTNVPGLIKLRRDIQKFCPMTRAYKLTYLIGLVRQAARQEYSLGKELQAEVQAYLEYLQDPMGKWGE